MKFYLPSQNLGCLGIRIGKYYADFTFRYGIFCTNGIDRYTVNLRGVHKWH